MKENMPDEGNLIAAYAWSRDSTEDLTQAVESAERAIAKIKAKAWDEGYEAGEDDALAHERGCTAAAISQQTTNPHE